MKKTEINDFINGVFGIGAKDPSKAEVGEVVLQNAAIDAEAQVWLPQLQEGLVRNDGIVEAREFLAPSANISMNGNSTYHYRFFPTKESIPEAKDSHDYARGWNGEFAYTDSKNEVRTATLENVGLSMVLEREMEKNDPTYYSRNFQKLVNIIESATLLTAINALESIAEAKTWNPFEGDLDAKLNEWMIDAGDSAGKDLNRVMFGRRAWATRLAYLNSANDAGNFLQPRTPVELGAMLGTDMYIPTARMSSGTVFPNVAANKIYGFIGQAGAGNEDVSNLKMFTGAGGLKMNRWAHPQGELEIITVSRWQKIQVVYPNGAFAVSVSNS